MLQPLKRGGLPVHVRVIGKQSQLPYCGGVQHKRKAAIQVACQYGPRSRCKGAPLAHTICGSYTVDFVANFHPMSCIFVQNKDDLNEVWGTLRIV